MQPLNHRKNYSSVTGAFISAAFAATLATSATYADDFAYDFVDIGYERSNPIDAGSLSGSYQLDDNIRTIAGLGFASAGFVDVFTLNAGLGYIFRPSETVNVVVDAGLNYFNIDTPFTDSNGEIGVFGSVKARVLIAPNFELEPNIGYTTPFDNDFNIDDFTFGVDARYYLSEWVAIQGGIGGSTATDDASFNIGFRFGRQVR